MTFVMKNRQQKGFSGKNKPSNARPSHKKDKSFKKDQPKSVTKSGSKDHSTDKKSAKVKIDLFGLHAVREAWVNPKRHIHNLYITDNALNAFDEALTKAHSMGLKRPSPQIVKRELLDESLQKGSVHQGVGLTCQEVEEIGLQDIIIKEQHHDKSVILMLDQVTDPHNVGAILRSACAFGAAGVVMQSRHAPNLTGVLAKTACGAVDNIDVAYETNLSRSIEALQEAGYIAIGLDERGEKTISQLPSFNKTVLVLGAEGDGMRRLVREKCDELVKLPTQEPIASLNVSNAAAVALYALLK